MQSEIQGALIGINHLAERHGRMKPAGGALDRHPNRRGRSAGPGRGSKPIASELTWINVLLPNIG